MWCPACAAESFEELWDAAFRVVLCDVMCWDCVRAGIFPTEDQIRAVLIRFDQEVQRAGYRMTWKDVAEHYQLSGLAVPSWAIE